MEHSKVLLTGLVLFLCCGFSVNGCEFSAIYNFGDSNSVTGGIKTPPPNAPGRICDGHVIIDFIAESLKLPFLNAYQSSLNANFQHGANFAIPGSTIEKINATDTPSLDEQIDKFKEFKSLIKNNAGKNDSLPKQMDFPKSLYTIDIGQNDFNAKLLSMSLDQLRPILASIANQLASSVRDIYQQEQGGRTFWIHNVGPIGCMPITVFNNHNLTKDEYGCIKSHNEIVIEFNEQLKEILIKLRAELKEAAITYVDIYGAKYRLISDAKKLGFDDPLKFCCRNKEDPGSAKCGEQSEVCKEPSKFISWDGVHYSHAANQWVANITMSGSLTDPPISISQSCNRQ